MYKVVGSPKTRAFRVIWMLEELGQSYEVDPARPRSDTAKALNPSGKVPILLVDGVPIIDSVAICQFLADRHGRMTAAAGTIERARQDSWTQFAVDDIEAPLWFCAKNTFVLPEELRSETAKAACKHDFDRAMTHLAARLGAGPYAMGEEFTVPDLLVGFCLAWAESIGWQLPEGAVKDYSARIRWRPAYLRAVAARERLTA